MIARSTEPMLASAPLFRSHWKRNLFSNLCPKSTVMYLQVNFSRPTVVAGANVLADIPFTVNECYILRTPRNGPPRSHFLRKVRKPLPDFRIHYHCVAQQCLYCFLRHLPQWCCAINLVPHTDPRPPVDPDLFQHSLFLILWLLSCSVFCRAWRSSYALALRIACQTGRIQYEWPPRPPESVLSQHYRDRYRLQWFPSVRILCDTTAWGSW